MNAFYSGDWHPRPDIGCPFGAVELVDLSAELQALTLPSFNLPLRVRLLLTLVS